MASNILRVWIDSSKSGKTESCGLSKNCSSSSRNNEFLSKTISRDAPQLSEPKGWLRYSNHLMTDGRFVGHAGYGGQFLLIDTKRKTSFSFLSVLENEDGYDDAYMGKVAVTLKNVLQQF